MKVVLKILWLFVAVLIHFFVIKSYLTSGSNTEVYIAEAWMMFFITFPLGIIHTFIWSFLANSFEIFQSSDPVVQTFSWFLSVVIGYVQWFVLLPKMINYYKAQKMRKAD